MCLGIYSRGLAGPPNIGINVGYQKTNFLALVYPRDFRPFWGSNVPFLAPTLQNVVQCTLFGPIPKSDLKHSITHFFFEGIVKFLPFHTVYEIGATNSTYFAHNCGYI